MDYTQCGKWFQIKKALRYIRLYGIRRTLIKIRSQYHMKRHYDQLPAIPADQQHPGHIGLIGCGNFAYSNIAFYLQKCYGKVIRAAMDIDIHHAASLFERYGLAYYTDDADRITADAAIDLVFIASNHASHAEYAIAALDAGKSVHIEKPHVVRPDQLQRLCRAMQQSAGRVQLGFNRPDSRLGQIVRRYLAGQDGPLMMNWFIAGHAIDPDHWYFSPPEGGRVLGNLCHWTDFTWQLVPVEHRYPITIIPTRAEKSDCDIAVTYIFGDGSIAAITFSAKGHTFEGVRERFAAHRGDVLLSMEDFQTATVEVVDRKHTYTQWFRDQGHGDLIARSYAMTQDAATPGAALEYVWETGELFLQTRQALEANRSITVTPFHPDKLDHWPDEG